MAPDRAVLQLRKFSWAPDKTGSKSDYSHVVADNLFLILEGGPGIGDRLKLQVVQATKVLDSIDLAYHIEVATNTRKRFLEADRLVDDRSLPTYAVCSGPKLAITHRREDGKIHRMQVAFAQESDCGRVVDLLKYRGMVFTEPATSAIPQDHAVSRPTTTSTMLTRMVEPSHHNSQTALFEPQAVSAVPQIFSRNERQAPRQLLLDRPTTREMFRSQSSYAVQPEYRVNPGRSSLHQTEDPGPSERSIGLNERSPADLLSNSFSIQGLNNIMQPAAYSTSPLGPSPLFAPRQISSLGKDARPQTHSSSAPSLPIPPQLEAQAVDGPTTKKRAPSRAGSSRGGAKKRTNTVDDIADDTSSMRPPTARPRSSVSRSSPKNMNELLNGKKPRQTVAQAKQSAQPASVSGSTSTLQLSSEGTDCMFGTPGLEEYAKLGDQDRDQILQRFIVSMLDNKAFEKLCEDLSVTWQTMLLNQRQHR